VTTPHAEDRETLGLETVVYGMAVVRFITFGWWRLAAMAENESG
jgi:hypothetical protein